MEIDGTVVNPLDCSLLKKLIWRFSPPKKVKNASWDILEVPAFAGMTMRGVGTGDSSLRWNRNAEPHDK